MFRALIVLKYSKWLCQTRCFSLYFRMYFIKSLYFREKSIWIILVFYLEENLKEFSLHFKLILCSLWQLQNNFLTVLHNVRQIQNELEIVGCFVFQLSAKRETSGEKSRQLRDAQQDARDKMEVRL